MALGRGTLAKIDRRVFAELNHSDGVQMVKVPVSDAAWSTWRRYCEALGVTMGQAVAGLIADELASVVEEVADGSTFDLERTSEERARRLDVREHELEERAAHLRRAEELLREREGRLRQKAAEAAGAWVAQKVGRNEACPCGSGMKYKLCHGLVPNG